MTPFSSQSSSNSLLNLLIYQSFRFRVPCRCLRVGPPRSSLLLFVSDTMKYMKNGERICDVILSGNTRVRGMTVLCHSFRWAR